MSIQATNRSAPTLSFGGIMRSEWIKLRTLRSTVWCWALVVVLTLAVGALLSLSASGGGTTDADQAGWLQATTISITFTQLVAAVLGALVITGEYGTGMIRSTFTAVPKRLPAVIAKAVVFGASTFILAAISLVATALVSRAILGRSGIDVDAGDLQFWTAVAGGAAYLTMIGLIAMGIGTTVRSSAGGIAAAIGLLLVVPTVMQLIAAFTRVEWVADAIAFLPSVAGTQMYAYVTEAAPAIPGAPLTLDPWQGLLVMIAWVVVLFAVALTLVKRRDA